MMDPLLSDLCNESNDKIMDFDDTELLTSNNNFDFHSFKEVKENNNGDVIGIYEEKIEKLSNEKIHIQSRLNNKVIELQTQIVKMKNALEKSELSKAEIEVEMTKVNKEMRTIQRQHNLKVSELEKSKFELTNHVKALDADYLNQISQLNTMHRLFQDQVSEEKRHHQKTQESLFQQINQLSEKVKATDSELSTSKMLQRQFEDTIKDQQLTILDLTKTIKEFEDDFSRNKSLIAEQERQIDLMKSSENKLREVIVELNAKINHLESKNFEEKHELNDSRNYQNNLQAQLLDLQQAQIHHDKDRQILLDKVNSANRRIKELDDSLNNQIKMAAKYRDQIKNLENDRDMQDISINEAAEDLQLKVEELESKLQIQTRVIDEVNDEISSSRENESLAVSHLTKTLEELENYIAEASGNVKTQNTSPRPHKVQLQVPGMHCKSSPRTSRLEVSGDVVKPTFDGETRSPSRNILKNVKHTILNFRERINILESDRQDALDKLQSQDKEIKNLKSQIRRFAAEQKSLQSENNEKQREIENLLDEISNVKSVSNVLKQETSKNITNLKQTLNKTSDEYKDNIEVRDNYLQTIANMIKDALSNGISSIIDKNNTTENHGDSRRPLKPENTSQNFSDLQNIIETSTQTHFIDNLHNKDNLQLSGNLTGTFRFLNENGHEVGPFVDTQCEKRTRYHPNYIERKTDHQVNNNVDDKKKSSIKKTIKKTDTKTDTNGTYVDSSKSWPALREVISSELVSLLNRYDVQRAQCQQLISELSAKESIITRLLSNQNSNSAHPHAPADSISRCQQTSTIETLAVNKSPNKVSTFSPNNVVARTNTDLKKKPRTTLKPKLEHTPLNISNKKCFKSENQKPPQLTRKLPTSPLVLTNKKVTTISTKLLPNSTGDQKTLQTDAPNSDVNTFSALKPTAISHPNTLPVTLKCHEIVDDNQCPDDQCDSRLFPIFIRVLLRLIHTSSRLKSTSDLCHFYKLCYHRSIDCSQLISINIDLEKFIRRSSKQVSRAEVKRPKFWRFKIVVHVITVCKFMSRIVLARKLFVPIDSGQVNVLVFKEYLNATLETSDQETDNIVETFIQFCENKDCQDLLIENIRRPNKPNKIITSSSNVVYTNLKKNVNQLKSICEGNVPLVRYKSMKKSYQMKLSTLMKKISELIHIIDGQNTVIEIRDDEIKKLKERVFAEGCDKSKLSKVISESKAHDEIESMEKDYNVLIIKQTKSYLSKMINLCKLFMTDHLIDFNELMKKEESIYRSFASTDCDDLIECVRDGICVALSVSGSVKSIIM